MFEFFRKNVEYLKKFVIGVALIAVFKTFDNLQYIFYSIGNVLSAATPFLAAFIVAYMLNLPVIKVENLLLKTKSEFVKKYSWGLSVFIVYILAICLVALTVGSLVPALYENVLEMTKSLPYYLSNLMNKFTQFEAIKNLNIDMSEISIESTMNSMLEMFDAAHMGEYMGRVFNMTSGVITGFIAFIASVYMLLDKENICKSLTKFINLVFKEKTATHILTYSRNINDIFTKFIYCRLVCCIICGAVCVVVLSVLNVKYAVVLGIFIGAMDMIPYFGSLISSISAIIITFVTGGIWQGIWVSVALLVIQQIDGNVIAPRLMGNSLELRPLWIVIAVSVGGSLFGFLGMLFSVPVLAVARAIVGEYLDELALKRQTIDEAADWEETK